MTNITSRHIRLLSPTSPPKGASDDVSLRDVHVNRKAQGSALMVILIILGLATALLVSALKSNPQIERDKITADALAKAKDALIGYAATYRDTHAGNVFGYLPCPDTDNNGEAEGSCGSPDVSLIGRLPWKTLGLPPLRDGSGECLWYAVSGRYKNNPPSAILNWDTAGQLIVNDAGGATLASGVAAAIFSPRNALGTQNRASTGTTECGGNTTVAAYLDGGDPIYAGTVPAAGANSTLTVATAASIANGTNNDQGLWITPDEIFKRIKQRNDFKSPALPANPNGDVNNLFTSVAACLNAQSTLPTPISINFTTMAESPGTTVGSIVTGRIPQNFVNNNCSNALTGIPTWAATWNSWWVSGITQTGKNFNDNWQDNLLYAKCSSGQCITVNGSPCAAVLMFSGERDTTTSPAQDRATASNKNTWSSYLEGNPLSLFNNGTPTSFTGAPASFTIANVNAAATADVMACINVSTPPPPETEHIQFAVPADFARFEIAGSGVTIDPVTQTAIIDVAGGSGGGCFWFPDKLSLKDRVLRAYYEFRFAYPDPSGGVDLGHGFTLSFLQGDINKPTSSTCGMQSSMGVIPASTYPFSLFVETDVSRQSANGEPSGTPNHTAIMANGNIVHSATNGNLTAACNGTAAGCSHAPSNKFEEDPTPSWHNQRIEIRSGYSDATCTTPAVGGAYSLVKAWVDCLSCSDTATSFLSTPTATRCIARDSSMDKIYFGFTAGFASSGGQVQGVDIKALDLQIKNPE